MLNLELELDDKKVIEYIICDLANFEKCTKTILQTLKSVPRRSGKL